MLKEPSPINKHKTKLYMLNFSLQSKIFCMQIMHNDDIFKKKYQYFF